MSVRGKAETRTPFKERGEINQMVREVLTLEQTAKRLGRSPRTLEKWIRVGRLRGSFENVDGKRTRVFDAGEVERMAQAVEEVAQKTGNRFAPLPKVEKEQREPEPTRELAPVPKVPDAMREMVAIVMREFAERLTENPLRRKAWLSPVECYRLSGLPAKVVVSLCERRQLVALPSGKSWRIQRASLEAFAG